MNITIEREQEHYVIKIDGEFYCSCDTIQEVTEEVAEIERQR